MFDHILHATIRMHLSESDAMMYDNFSTLEKIVEHLWEEGSRNKDIYDPTPLQLHMKEYGSIMAHIKKYESLNS